MGRILLLAAVLAAPLFAGGCGNKGDLYLPDAQPPAASR